MTEVSKSKTKSKLPNRNSVIIKSRISPSKQVAIEEFRRKAALQGNFYGEKFYVTLKCVSTEQGTKR